MVYRIVWSTDALQTFIETASYLEREWGTVAAKRFADRLDKLFETLRHSPTIFRATSQRKHTYRTSINKHLTIVYEINSPAGEVYILQLWHSRSNPDSFKF